ncbi:I78 family peptidase inhibitor [Jannaschia seohaensis]|uniref:Peptidase inhibitor I78 family protein n=1 Tax=Jannaschia seohaensis TaxID=475081 RepID=A0A2Y9A203_9RHOB|nr:I78 family peptidase inhibitor [Jannaschia seohaensis]PWJ22146.1 peptidase inhibitor I78 family protein [Jannaschia seohaensis]SSA38424.1 Peptidase inhibitor I78 family protein [Jannaschia seohaensis]
MRWMIPLILVLAACQQGADDPCGAADYAGLVGTNIAAVTLPADLDARIVGPDTAVTMDFIPTRLNIRTDAEGTVMDLTCG